MAAAAWVAAVVAAAVEAVVAAEVAALVAAGADVGALVAAGAVVGALVAAGAVVGVELDEPQAANNPATPVIAIPPTILRRVIRDLSNKLLSTGSNVIPPQLRC